MLYLPELLPFFIKGKKDHIDRFRFNNGYLVYVITHSDDVSELRPVREVGVYRRVGGSYLIESLIIESLSNEEINTLLLEVKNENFNSLMWGK